MNIVEWINQNAYHTTSCDKHRRVLGQECICGKDKCISELSKPITEHPDVQKLIIQIQKLQKAIAIADQDRQDAWRVIGAIEEILTTYHKRRN